MYVTKFHFRMNVIPVFKSVLAYEGLDTSLTKMPHVTGIFEWCSASVKRLPLINVEKTPQSVFPE